MLVVVCHGSGVCLLPVFGIRTSACFFLYSCFLFVFSVLPLSDVLFAIFNIIVVSLGGK